jgi:hypothetical protein
LGARTGLISDDISELVNRRGGDLVKKQGIRGGDLVKKQGIRGDDLFKKQRMRGVITSLKNQEPALNRGLTGERSTSDLAPSWLWTGGGKEPALNRGLTGERPTSDLAPS